MIAKFQVTMLVECDYTDEVIELLAGVDDTKYVITEITMIKQ